MKKLVYSSQKVQLAPKKTQKWRRQKWGGWVCKTDANKLQPHCSKERPERREQENPNLQNTIGGRNHSHGD